MLFRSATPVRDMILPAVSIRPFVDPGIMWFHGTDLWDWYLQERVRESSTKISVHI